MGAPAPARTRSLGVPVEVTEPAVHPAERGGKDYTATLCSEALMLGSAPLRAEKRTLTLGSQ